MEYITDLQVSLYWFHLQSLQDNKECNKLREITTGNLFLICLCKH